MALQGNVSNAFSESVENHSVPNAVERIVASPYCIKTQVAKIPSSDKPSWSTSLPSNSNTSRYNDNSSDIRTSTTGPSRTFRFNGTKTNKNSPSTQTSRDASRELTKQRLAQLNKNTKTLLAKNLQRKRQKLSTAKIPAESRTVLRPVNKIDENMKKPLGHRRNENFVLKRTEVGEEKMIPLKQKGNSNVDQMVLPQKPCSSHEAVKTKTVEPVSGLFDALMHSGAINPNPPQWEIHQLQGQHIGLLRMPDSNNKLQKNLKTNNSERSEDIKVTMDALSSNLQYSKKLSVASLDVNVDDKSEASHNSFKATSKLSTVSKRKRSAFHKPTTSSSGYPFWLRPHPVQIYPYNFILAVRRKLETIITPPIENNIEVTKCDSSHELLSNISNKCDELVEVAMNVHDTQSFKDRHEEENLESLNKGERIAISIHDRLSSTDTGLGELNTESISKGTVSSQVADDDTTISSSVFDIPLKLTSNPSNDLERSVTPETLDELNSKSRKELKEAMYQKRICTSRGSSEFIDCRRSKPEMDLTNLLKDFNRSLREAIKVNERLKYKTDSSYRITTSERGAFVNTDPTYKSDFTTATTDRRYCEDTNELEKSCSSTLTDIRNENKHSTPHSKTNGTTVKRTKNHLKSENDVGSDKSSELYMNSKVGSSGNSTELEVPSNYTFTVALPTSQQTDKLSFKDRTADMKEQKGINNINPEGGKKTKLISKTLCSSKYINGNVSQLPISQESSDLESLNTSRSEHSLNYSTVGLYEQLINAETSKSEQLVALLKIREKLLIDRTKSQIAWLEVQKERFKSKNMLHHITSIKKKQRGLLLKMEKDRQEIKRLLQNNNTKATDTLENAVSKITLECEKNIDTQKCLVPSRHKRIQNEHRTESIVRGDYTIESTHTLEELLRKRESKLQQRRQHVDYLIQWHKRLDCEESEVLQLEHMLINSNNAVTDTSNSNSKPKPNLSEIELCSSDQEISNYIGKEKMDRRLKDIENSLGELHNISSSSRNSFNKHKQVDCVYTTGIKLNNLWRRLTSQHIEKFEPNKRYKLCKEDLEQLYEEAKCMVLKIFTQEREAAQESFEKYKLDSLPQFQSALVESEKSDCSRIEEIEVQQNDNSQTEDATSFSTQFSRHCQCATNDSLLYNSSTETESMESDRREINDRKAMLERNKQAFLTLSRKVITNHMGLQRSHSDPKICSKDMFVATDKANEDILKPAEEVVNQTEAEMMISISKSTEHLGQSNRTSVICSVGLPIQSSTICTERDTSTVDELSHIAMDKSPAKEISSPSSENNRDMPDNDITTTEQLNSKIDYSSQFEEASSEMNSSSRYTIFNEKTSKQTQELQLDSFSNSQAETEGLIKEDSCIEDESIPQLYITDDSSTLEIANSTDEDGLTLENAHEHNTSPPSTIVRQESLNSTQLMPDIINNLENRRCQHVGVDSEKHCENISSIPYVYVREIPNKPPPPYVPPAPGSPMTTIFPSEERIKNLTFRRTHELFCQFLNIEHLNSNGEKLPSVMEEKITNIYERIILDICKEFLEEHQEILIKGDPSNFNQPLVFYNPPDRLRCIQNSIYKEVRCCLAMNKTSPQRSQVYSIYGHRAKRDHIGKIIVQELYDEDEQWCNFQSEENEVLKLVIDEMVAQYAREIIDNNWTEHLRLNSQAESATSLNIENETITLSSNSKINNKSESAPTNLNTSI